ncbi:YhdP family protein [Acidimangrovimonas sediminis]|uniref:YhdP family protein n=1 Tax=Acidimangrovimonas sediminis TaxID=2056283 RepID=UPI000C7FB5A2|nr:AsmA-like C-terminal region-containing protein [Acidimangrovimonas sediminis]
MDDTPRLGATKDDGRDDAAQAAQRPETGGLSDPGGEGGRAPAGAARTDDGSAEHPDSDRLIPGDADPDYADSGCADSGCGEAECGERDCLEPECAVTGDGRPGGGPRRRGRFGIWLLLSLVLLAGAGGFGVMAMTGKPLIAPEWAVSRIEARVNRSLDGRGRISLGGVAVVLDQNYVPRVRLRDVRFLDGSGNALMALPEVRVSLAVAPLLEGRIRPERVRISGASLMLKRDPSGAIDLAMGQGIGSGGPPITSPGDLLERIDAIFAQPELSGLTRIEADALSITLDDQRAGRIWQVTDGRASLVQDARQISLELGFGLVGRSGEPARAVFTFVGQKHSPAARLSARVTGVASSDIAAQAPALAWLKLIDAPISGDFRASVNDQGQLGPMEGQLKIGKGALKVGEQVKPVPLQHGTLAFTYAPKSGRISITEASVDSRILRIHAAGQVLLEDVKNGLPRAFLGQMKFAKVMVDPEGLFEKPVRFSQGALDLKLKLDPFDVELGQLVLIEGKRRIDAKARLTATPKGLKVALDAKVNEIRHDQLLALWPVNVVDKTREWLADNVLTGVLSNVNVALRLTPGETPRLALGYDFSGADVRVIKTLPPVEDGEGYATIEGNTYTMVIHRGHVTPPKGGAVDVSGSVFQVPDITAKPAPAVVTLKTSSSVTAALSLLDEPPFEFLTKAGQPVDLANGRARVTAVIKLPLQDKIDLPDVTYNVNGEITGVSSSKIVPDRVLTSDRLQLHADPSGIRIWGPGKLGPVAFDGEWSQKFGPEHAGHSEVTGTVTLSPVFASAFNLGLPPGALSGAGRGRIRIVLDKDKAPRFTLTSDLKGLTLKIPEIGWSKPAATAGTLDVAGSLGTPPEISKLVLKGPGLAASGDVRINGDGTLGAVHLASVKAGNWLDAPVDLVGQGKGKPVAVTLPGGTVDLSKLPQMAAGNTSQAVPITTRLDRLKISDTLSMTGFTGSFTTLGGFNGKFAGRVNGTAPVQGTVAPASTRPGARSAVRVTSADAGAVFRAAGIYDRMHGGQMRLTLVPEAARGDYDGQLRVDDIRVQNAPALADLLNAISVVGLLEQLNGQGLVFSTINAGFKLTPKGVEVDNAAAVGASLGVSAQGTYTFGGQAFDLQGVVSPIYLLNGVGQLISRQGEGVFGFNYALRGTAKDPKISVNPLSVLAPGFLRDLLRKPAAKLGE